MLLLITKMVIETDKEIVSVSKKGTAGHFVVKRGVYGILKL